MIQSGNALKKDFHIDFYNENGYLFLSRINSVIMTNC